MACGDGGGDPTDQRGALCELYRTACEREVECGVYLFGNASSVESCLAALDCDAVIEDAAAGGVEISITNANSCRAGIAAASCSQLQPWQDGAPAAYMTVHDDCANVLVGTRREGEACVRGEQCADGLACEGTTCPGSCVPETSAACQPFSCEAGSFCDSFQGCVPRAALGARCEPSSTENACVDGAFCNFDSETFETTCVPVFAANEECDAGGYYSCQGGNVCRDAGDGTNRCLPVLALGESCFVFDQCGVDAYCDFAGGGRCATPKPLGATCGDAFNECGKAAECLDGTCQPVNGSEPEPGPIETRPTAGEGEDCEMANCEPGLACRPSGEPIAPTWTCEPAFALGESCRGPEGHDVQLLSQRGADACSEGVCDILGSFTCVVQKQAGEACSTEGFTAECTSLFCSGGTCAPLFDCP